MVRFSVFVLFVLAGSAAAADTHPASYAGQERREIKALAPDEIQGYLDGKGAGLAKAAELNHYPGPSHVLELADTLRLDEGQRSRSTAVFAVMRKEAVRLGEALVAQERELDRLFASRRITADNLATILDQIGALQAALRGAHLRAHIEQRDILTEAQVARYDELRGYRSAAGAETGSQSHRH